MTFHRHQVEVKQCGCDRKGPDKIEKNVTHETKKNRI